MSYLLDTNAVIALMKGLPSFVTRVRQYRPHDFYLSSVVTHELFFGAYKSQRQAENLARIGALRFEVLDFDYEDSREAGRVRAALAGEGAPIGPYDVQIAGQAIARKLTLISRNTREFGRVPGLQVENWEI